MTETTPNLTPAQRREYERAVLPLMADMTRKARALTRSASDADDLVQETLVRAYRFWGSYRPEAGSVKAWLYTTLRNTFRNRYAAAVARTRWVDGATAEGVTNMAVMPEADSATVAADVRALVDALPADYAAVVRAVDLEGMEYAEAAEALGCPKGTVMSRLYRGRKRLQEMVAA